MVNVSDGCGVVQGIFESTRGDWSGDVNLNDGQVQELYVEYKEQLQWVEGIGLGNRRDCIRHDINITINDTGSDLEFVHSGNKVVHYVCLYSFY